MIDIQYKSIWRGDEDRAILKRLSDYLNARHAAQYGLEANGGMTLASQSIHWWYIDPEGRRHIMCGLPPVVENKFASFLSEYGDEIAEAQREGRPAWLPVGDYSEDKREELLDELLDRYSCSGEIQDGNIVLNF